MKLVPFRELTPEQQADARKLRPYYFDSAESNRFYVTKLGTLAKRRKPVSETVIIWTQMLYDQLSIYPSIFEKLSRKAGDTIKYG